MLYVYNKLMNTVSTFVGPSTILLLPGVGVFLPSGGSKFRFPTGFRRTLGLQVVVCQHAGASIVVVWHCICV